MGSKDVLMAIKNEESIEVLEALARVIESRITLLKCLEEIEKDTQKGEWAGASEDLRVRRIKGNKSMYNKVGLLSENNRSCIIVDGVEIKGVTRLDVHRDTKSLKTVISIDFECDLDTVERKKDRFFVDERE